MDESIDEFYSAAYERLTSTPKSVQKEQEEEVEEVKKVEYETVTRECYCPDCEQECCVMRGQNNAYLYSEIFESSAVETLLSWAKLGVLEKRLKNLDEVKRVITTHKPKTFEGGLK